MKIPSSDAKAQEWLLWLKWFCRNRKQYELSKEESLALRDAVVKSERVAKEFFYVVLSPMNKGLVYECRKSYRVCVDERDIASILYTECYNSGTFSPLKTFDGDCGLFSWIARIAAQKLYNKVCELYVIDKPKELSAKNTSLTLKSMKYKEEKIEVISLVSNELWHGILTAIYVDGKTPEEVMLLHNMEPKTFRKTLKVAETTLKEALIAANMIPWRRIVGSKEDGGSGFELVNLVTIALSDVSGLIDCSSLNEGINVVDSFDDDIYNYVYDSIRLRYPDLSPEAAWREFVIDQSSKCGMSEQMLKVWTSRFVRRESAESTAKHLDIQRYNVDNIYSRSNKLLALHIRQQLGLCA